MTNKKQVWGMLALALTFGLVVMGCPTDGGEPDPWPLEEHLRKYIAPEKQTWGEGDNAEDVSLYFLAPDRFEAFKAELEAGGEYSITDDSWNDTRDWDTGMTFVRWAVKPNGRCDLELCKEDNSRVGYTYQEASSGAKPKTEKLLRKYMGPKPEKWGEDGGKITYVYSLDPTRFNEFKAELDAGGAYSEAESWTNDDENRSDKTRARWCVRPSGLIFRLDLWNDNDKHEIGYRYVKNG
jgi:hypothetical protein